MQKPNNTEPNLNKQRAHTHTHAIDVATEAKKAVVGNSGVIFTEAEQVRIVDAIKNAEKNTSGELVLHVEDCCEGVPVLERAATVFKLLNLQATAQRNGVLIFLSTDDHQFAILGDVGINRLVDNCFWQDVRDLMKSHFMQGNITEGCIAGILLAGEKLAEHFPYQKDDVDELPNDISFGSNL